MSSNNHASDGTQELVFQDYVVNFARKWFNQHIGVFGDMSVKNWLRIIIIVGGYLLIRPHLVKYGAKVQEKQHEKESAEQLSKISPNDLRVGQPKVAIPGLDSEDEEKDEVDTSATNWGRGARVRQRKLVRKTMEEHERKLQEEEEDKDIERYLS